MPAVTIYTKRWDDPQDESDGTRILVTRFRPRGLRKEEETWSEWLADLAPTAELHAAAYGKGREAVGWSTYKAAYLKQMLAQRPLIQQLAQRALGGEVLTLLCSSQCARESRCHRSLLKELIEAEVGRIGDQCALA